MRFRTGNAFLRDSSRHCNWAGDDCWHVKTHPKIESISVASGYQTGGQTLTVNGWGLKAEKNSDAEVTVDGVACKVTETSAESLTCITGKTENVSFEGSQPGSPGVLSRVIEPTGNPSWNYRDPTKIDEKYVTTKLLTNWEDNHRRHITANTHSKGWFKAPETGKYRFHISSRNDARFYFDSTAKFAKDADATSTMTEVAYHYGNTGWRRYHLDPTVETYNNVANKKYVSDWISLEAGDYHEIESYTMHWHHDTHSTAAVEFEKEDSSGHHHSNKEIQILEVTNDITYEEYDITVANPNKGGRYQIILTNPNFIDGAEGNDGKRQWVSDYIYDNWDGWRMCWKLQHYYINFQGGSRCSSSVKYMNDSDEEVSKGDATKWVYNVKVNGAIIGKGFSSWTVLQ